MEHIKPNITTTSATSYFPPYVSLSSVLMDTKLNSYLYSFTLHTDNENEVKNRLEGGTPSENGNICIWNNSH